jgi:fatty-acyl-CoA synthase
MRRFLLGQEITPTRNNLPLRSSDFANLADALDYAAQGVTGSNFYTGRGELYAVLPYRELRSEARVLARRLLGLRPERGARVAIIAETSPDFLRLFFACQYAGLVPVPLPIPIHLGGHKAYVAQLRGMLLNCQASVAMARDGFLSFLEEATQGLGLKFVGTPTDFDALPEVGAELCPLQNHEVAYLQYTSGSTRFPRGVMITQRAVMSNAASIIREGVRVRPTDRCVSWLPFYHDMGLVGLVLVPMAAQLSVDYLGTREFAMRPRQWLALMSRNRATISFSPPFGFELCNRRLREGEAEKFDLRHWRLAGVGAETIRPTVLREFAEVLAPSGFDARAFTACYGMAECSLAVSFAPLGHGLQVDRIDADHLAQFHEAVAVGEDTADAVARVSEFVKCGVPLSEFELVIRDDEGRELPERHSGTIFVRAPSVMQGYFNDPESTRGALSEDGWLDTGDIGYLANGNVVITGRKKDVIIINGRNIWPQDLEYIAEQQPEVRPGDALAFSAPGPAGEDATVMLVQCRESDSAKRAGLILRLREHIHAELGIDCHIELAPLHTLPRTSSGKLSRSKAQHNYIVSHVRDGVAGPGMLADGEAVLSASAG